MTCKYNLKQQFLQTAVVQTQREEEQKSSGLYKQNNESFKTPEKKEAEFKGRQNARLCQETTEN